MELCVSRVISRHQRPLKRCPLYPRKRTSQHTSDGVPGVFDSTETLHLAAARAEVMDAVRDGPQGLLFVRSLSRSTIDALCRQTQTFIAIINPSDAYLIGGSDQALGDLEIACRKAGATRSHRIGVHV